MNQCDRIRVEKQYTWDGKLSTYKRTHGDQIHFIPIDHRNSDYRRLLEEIASGAAEVSIQQATSAFPTHSQEGTQTGYDTDIGFIPRDPENPKYAALVEAITKGTCTVSMRNAQPVGEDDFVAELIVCVFFSQAWPHVIDSFEGEISVRPNSNASPKPFRFVIRNLRDLNSKGELELVLTAHGCENFNFPHQSPGIPTGVLEIIIQVSDLKKIFRGEVSEDASSEQPWLKDLLAMELCRAGRTKKEGPATQWLIDNAHNYFSSFASDVSNRIVEAFWNEYGGIPMGHVSPFTLQRQFVIIRRTRSGKRTLGIWKSSIPYSFNLSGQWGFSVGLDAVSDASAGYQNRFQRALSRLRMLIEGGFHMEAVVLVNAVLEVSVTSALCQCAVSDLSLATQIRQLGHRRRLNILSKLVESRESEPFSAEIPDFLHAAFELYAHRNNYVHDLTLPDKGAVLRHREQRKLHQMLQHFSDPWRQRAWFDWLNSIASGDRDAFRLAKAECESGEK